MSRRRLKLHKEASSKEPLLLWWMPVVALASPLLYAAWVLATADRNALSDALTALLWPGAGLYAATLAVLWGGWKIPLE